MPQVGDVRGITWMAIPKQIPDTTPYGFNFQPYCRSHCAKSLDLLATDRLWPESGTHAMGCGDEVHTIFKLLTHHDFGLG